MNELHVIVRGRVQGVGFRDATQDRALALGVVGWVRNLSDGSVEAYARGEADAVAALRGWLSSGPPAAQVLEVTDLSASGQQRALCATDSFARLDNAQA